MMKFEEEQKNVNEMEDWTEKTSKKKWIVFFSVIALIVASLGAYYTYFYIYQNTERYIDNTIESFRTTSQKMLDQIKETKNGMQYDSNLDTRISYLINVKKNKKEIMDIDLLIENSFKQDIFNAIVDLKKENSSLFNAEIFTQDEMVYLKAKDIYDKILGTELDEDSLTEQLKELYDIAYNIDENMVYIFTKLIEYQMEALKEGKLSTRPNGLNQKEYIITVGEEEKEAISRRIETLIKKDKILSKLQDVYDIEYTSISTGTYKINVDVFTNQLKSFSFDLDGNEINGEYDGEKFVISFDDDYINIWVKEDGIKGEYYQNEVLLGNIIINQDKININTGDTVINFEVIDEKINIEIKTPEIELALDILTEVEKDYVTMTGKGILKIENEEYEIDYNIKAEFKEGIVSKKDVTGFAKIDELTEEELLKIQENMYNLLNKFGLLDLDFMEGEEL